MNKEFTPFYVACLFVLSVSSYFLIFWEGMHRTFARYTLGFVIAFCIGAAILLIWLVMRKNGITVKQLLLGSVIAPYFLAIIGYIGVSLHFVLFTGNTGKDFGLVAPVIALFFPYWVGKVWWLTILMFGWLLSSEVIKRAWVIARTR